MFIIVSKKEEYTDVVNEFSGAGRGCSWAFDFCRGYNFKLDNNNNVTDDEKDGRGDDGAPPRLGIIP